MKKTLSVFLAMMLVFALAALPVSAEEDTGLTREEMMYQVVLAGFADPAVLAATDYTPDRLGAAEFVISMVGAWGDIVPGEDYDLPFVDVPDEYAPYVAYLYENGYTKGVSPELFGADDEVTFAQFYTFVLRALMYDEGEDFTYATALEDAYDLGVMDNYTYLKVMAGDTTFTMGDMIVAMYNCLASYAKDSAFTLIDILIAEECISMQSYELFYGTNDLYNMLMAGDEAESVALSGSMVIAADDEETEVLMDAKVATLDGAPRMLADMAVTSGDEVTDTSVYFDGTDIYMYTQATGWFDMSAMLGGLALGMELPGINASQAMVMQVIIDMLGMEVEQDDESITLSGELDFSGYMSFGFEGYDITMGPIDTVIEIDKDTLLPVYMSLELSVTVQALGDEAAPASSVDASCEFTFDGYNETEIELDAELEALLAA